MGDKKYLLIILSLFFIKFLNLNATVFLKDNSRQLFPYKGVVELNFTYKYVENGKFTEIYDENGKLKKRKMQRGDKSKDVEYNEIGEVVKKYN